MLRAGLQHRPALLHQQLGFPLRQHRGGTVRAHPRERPLQRGPSARLRPLSVHHAAHGHRRPAAHLRVRRPRQRQLHQRRVVPRGPAGERRPGGLHVQPRGLRHQHRDLRLLRRRAARVQRQRLGLQRRHLAPDRAVHRGRALPDPRRRQGRHRHRRDRHRARRSRAGGRRPGRAVARLAGRQRPLVRHVRARRHQDLQRGQGRGHRAGRLSRHAHLGGGERVHQQPCHADLARRQHRLRPDPGHGRRGTGRRLGLVEQRTARLHQLERRRTEQRRRRELGRRLSQRQVERRPRRLRKCARGIQFRPAPGHRHMGALRGWQRQDLFRRAPAHARDLAAGEGLRGIARRAARLHGDAGRAAVDLQALRRVPQHVDAQRLHQRPVGRPEPHHRQLGVGIGRTRHGFAVAPR